VAGTGVEPAVSVGMCGLMRSPASASAVRRGSALMWPPSPSAARQPGRGHAPHQLLMTRRGAAADSGSAGSVPASARPLGPLGPLGRVGVQRAASTPAVAALLRRWESLTRRRMQRRIADPKAAQHHRQIRHLPYELRRGVHSSASAATAPTQPDRSPGRDPRLDQRPQAERVGDDHGCHGVDGAVVEVDRDKLLR
jgi:hypothetical protein